MYLKHILKQSKKYAKNGVGLFGILLKHSLIPVSLFKKILPERGILLDLGCGEGVLSNIVALQKPGLQVLGIDKNVDKIIQARRSAPSNTQFIVGDALIQDWQKASVVVINDVLHHYSSEQQLEFLKKVATFLDDDGLLILKEVDKNDRFDYFWTRFWDSRLYPEDTLNFKSKNQWKNSLYTAGFRFLSDHSVRHFWPASRTIIVCKKEKKFPLPEKIIPTTNTKTLKILITGGSGFIGRHLVSYLAKNGISGQKAEIFILTRNKQNILPEVTGYCHIIEGDINTLEEKSVELGNLDYVFHLAAHKDFFGKKQVYTDNVSLTKTLLKMLKKQPQLKRLIFTSSMGAVDRDPSDPCYIPLSEQTIPHPSSSYGKAKLECEQIIRESGLPHTLLRLPWCYGPGMSRSTHIRALTEMVKKNKIATFFDWPGKLSILNVLECVQIITAVASDNKTINDTYNLCDDEPIGLGKLLREIGKFSEKRAAFIPIPLLSVRLIRLLRRFIPFTIKSLFLDSLCMTNNKLKTIGYSYKKRTSVFLVPFFRFINQEEYPAIEKSSALITGASSGIGQSMAIYLSAQGYQIILVDKNSDENEATTKIPGTTFLLANISNDQDMKKIQNLMTSNSINWVVNCAGIGHRALFHETSQDMVSSLIDVNIKALTLLSQTALQSFNLAREGILINIASSAAFQPLPGMAIYSASKSYVLIFSESLRGELTQKGIAIITICPSGVQTNFQKTAGVRENPNEKLLSPDLVAKKIIRFAQQRHSGTYYIGKRVRYMALISRLLPRSFNVRLWKNLMYQHR